VVGGDECNINE
nr:RecName: Full=Thrombin-like enzyme albolabrase; Short=SVTLE albolabrase; AltName: Full=Fibrinogen-clotting enzyme; AltName: Full=Snake venom serine protease; Short=SVSP [Trimeresurus albolabris]